MDDNDLMASLKGCIEKDNSCFTRTSFDNSTRNNLLPRSSSYPQKETQDDAVIVSEIPITAGQLHSIASGQYCMIGEHNEPFAVRFLLKKSFRIPKKNYVVRNIVMQIVAVGKDNVMRREHIATDVKIQKVSKANKKPEKIKSDFKVSDSQENLF